MSSNLTTSNTTRLFSVSDEVLHSLGCTSDATGALYLRGVKFAEQMCELTNHELARMQGMPLTPADVPNCFPEFDLESTSTDSVALIGGFFSWDSEHAEIVDLGADYEHALGVKLHDSESGSTVVLIRPEETLTKLLKLETIIDIAYQRRELERMGKTEVDALSAVTPTVDEATAKLIHFRNELKREQEKMDAALAPMMDAALGTTITNGNVEPFEATAAKAIEALSPSDLLLALDAEPAITEAETERDGTLLSNEVICALIQRLARLEMSTTERCQALAERMGEQVEKLEGTIELITIDKDSLQRLIENEVESQIDDYDFKTVVKDALEDIDITEQQSFTDAVKSIIDETDFDDEIERVVNAMDLSDSVKDAINNMDLSQQICSNMEKMDFTTLVMESLDGEKMFLTINGTHEGSGALKVTFSS